MDNEFDVYKKVQLPVVRYKNNTNVWYSSQR